ncbi:cupredoxin domain-containing protein [Psychrobacter pygoscelis]|uniref:cupredoxin domain-containing protein n=1 Tax=Psychrobacter pygoscelis TaxID=2488563 RepID=UPI001A954D47|nr:cupredoxin domain-containing protein [Psychrobacter pygoscelis]
MNNSIKALLLLGCAMFSFSSFAASMPNIGNSSKITSSGYSQQVHHKRYDDLPAYLVEMKDGKLMPNKLVVPAKQKFRIIVRNLGTKPAEFESNQLRQEKILYMGTESVVLVMPLSPGTYDYYDDFTPGANGLIVAK